MAFTLGLAQASRPADGNVVSSVERFMQAARTEDVDMLVFPEALMSSGKESIRDFIAAAQPLGGPFTRAVDTLAARYGLWVVYTMNETNPAGNPFNTAVVTDSSGLQRGIYRKVHLFDTENIRESDRMAPGNSLFETIETPFCRLGLGICYDLRFPEVARHAAREGCDVMLYPAAWVDGELKARQWRTLLEARAIENEMFVGGVSRPDEGCIGQSCVVDPFGVIRASAGTGDELVICRIKGDAVTNARRSMPLLTHLRNELYR